MPTGKALKRFRIILPALIHRYRKALTGEMKHLVKVQFSKRQYGKIYYAVIRERYLTYQTMFPISCEKTKRQTQIFSAGLFLPVAVDLSSNQNPKP